MLQGAGGGAAGCRPLRLGDSPCDGLPARLVVPLNWPGAARVASPGSGAQGGVTFTMSTPLLRRIKGSLSLKRYYDHPHYSSETVSS